VAVTRHFSIRDPELIQALDRIVAAIRHRHPGRKVSRESLARELLYAATRRTALVRAVSESV
jgi:hypothetical protein